MVLTISIIFLCRLRCIFAVTILWSEDYLSKRGVRLTVQSALYSRLVYEYVIYLCFSIIWVGVGPELSIRFLKSSIKAYLLVFGGEVCLIFLLLDELCKQNLLFSSLPIWVFVFPPMIVFGNASNKGRSLVVDTCFITGICGTVARDDCCAGVAVKWSSHPSRLYFINAIKWLRARRRISFSTPPMMELTKFFHADSETNVHPLPGYFIACLLW